MDDLESPWISRRLDLIARKLDALIRLQVMGMSHGKNQTEQIRLYSIAGLQPKEIAEHLGTTPNTVRVILFNLRKSRRQRLRH